MTTEELIIGYFDNALDTAELDQLNTILDNSSEARALFEHHKNIQATLDSDSETVAPALWLEQAALQSALTAAVGTTSTAVSFWTATKVAFLIGTTALSGIGATFLLSRTESAVPEQHQAAPAPVQYKAPAPGNAPVSAPETTPAVTTPPVTASPETVSETPKESVARTTESPKPLKNHGREGRTTESTSDPDGKINLGSAGKVVIPKGTKVQSAGGK